MLTYCRQPYTRLVVRLYPPVVYPYGSQLTSVGDLSQPPLLRAAIAARERTKNTTDKEGARPWTAAQPTVSQHTMQGHESAGGRGRKGAPLHAAQAPKHSGGRGEWRSIQGKGRDFDNVETIA